MIALQGFARFLVLALPCAATPIWQLGAQSLETAPDTSDDIIVTARQQSELLGQVAAPVTVVEGKVLQNEFATKLSDLDDILPELTIQPTGTGNLVFLRGVGNFSLQPNSDPAVGFSYDGVLVGRPGGNMGQLYDIARVELLKGPQGVLYGRNASVGAIKVEPRHPVLELSEVSAEAAIGSFSLRRLTGTINIPLGKLAALRASAAFASSGTYLEGYLEGEQQESMRLQFRFDPSPRISLRLASDYSHLGGVGAGSSYIGRYAFSLVNGRYEFVPSGLPSSEGLYAPASQSFRQGVFLPLAGRNLGPLTATPSQNNEIYGSHLHLEADLGFARLIVLPAWRVLSLNLVNSGSPFGYRIFEKDQQKSLESRLSGRIGDLEWLAGFLLFNEAIDSRTATDLSSSLILSEQIYDTSSRALFANLVVHVSSSMRVSAGIRRTHDNKSFGGRSDTLGILCLQRVSGLSACPGVQFFPLVSDLAELPQPIPSPGSRQPIFVEGIDTGAVATRGLVTGAGQLSSSRFDWRAGGEVDLSGRGLLYVTAETGHRPGGFNIATGFETYGPERLTALTIGLRHRAFGDRVQLHGEAFWWNYAGQQVSSLRPDLSTPPRNANITENIGNSLIRGLEIEGRLHPLPGLTIRAVAQYLDAHYRSFKYRQVSTGVPPLTGCAATLQQGSNIYLVDCAMKQPYNSPRWSWSVSARQSFPAGRLLLTAEIDTRFRSSRNIGFAFLPEQHVAANSTTDFRATVAPAHGKWEISASVENFEAKRTPEFMIYHPVSNLLVAGTSSPRRFAIRFSRKY